VIEINATQIIRLLRQGESGYHPLFSEGVILRALNKQPMGSVPHYARIRDAVLAVMALPTVTEQRAYVDGLAVEEQDLLVRLYFKMLEQFMRQTNDQLH
jgi:hypothetical protein